MNSSDYPRDGQSVPPEPAPPPKKPNPPWMIWAIVGVATLLVVGIVGVAIAGMANRGGRGASSAQSGEPTSATRSPQQLTEAVDELRSHMPPALRTAVECEQAANGSYARAAVDCIFSGSAVPATAAYRLYADVDLMNTEARELHQLSAPVDSCRSPENFSAGGQETWTMDGRQRGTTWCYVARDGRPVILWSDDNLRILSYASAPTIDDTQELVRWYTEEGGPV